MSRLLFSALPRPFVSASLAASALLLAVPACAQYDSGTVLGSIKDPSGPSFPEVA